MQEERLTVIDMIQNDLISALDGKRLLEALSSDEEENLGDPGYRSLRLSSLLWLSRHQINTAQALEMLQIINDIARKHDIKITEQELGLLLQMRTSGTLEARTLIDLLKTLEALFDHDMGKENTRKIERLEILNLVQNGKITGSTAIDLLRAFLPQSSREAASPQRSSHHRNHSPRFPSVGLPKDFGSQLGRSIREEFRRIIPEQKPRTAERRTGVGPSPEIHRSYDIHSLIQNQVQHTLEEGRRSAGQSSKVVRSRQAEPTKPMKKSHLNPLMDRLHDYLRETELTSKAVEQNWFALNQTPTPSNLDSLMQRMQASLGTIHQKLARVSEARASLELHVSSVEEDERAIALELLEHAKMHYQKYTERLKELEVSVAELAAVGQMRHEEELRGLDSTKIDPEFF